MNKDEKKTKKELLEEMKRLRVQITEHEKHTRDCELLRQAHVESEDRFYALADNSPNMVFINQDGRIVYVNKKCEEIIGYSRERFMSPDFDFFSLIAPESLDLIISYYEKHMRGEEVVTYEYKIITASGAHLEASNTSKLIQYSGKKAILGIVTDVSKIRRAEESLKQSEERFRKIFESSREGILILNMDQNIISANPGATEMLRFRKPSLLEGLTIKELISRPQHSSELFKNLIELDYSKDFEMVLKREDNTPINVLSSLTIHRNAVGEPENIQIAFMDITDRKKAEIDMKRRLMKFRIEEGNTYLFTEIVPTFSFEIFRDLHEVGYTGAIISRDPKEDYSHAQDIVERSLFYWLSESETEGAFSPDIMQIERLIQGMDKGRMVLITRLDYLVKRNGFDDVLASIQRMRDIAYLRRNIILISVDRTTLTDIEYAHLSKECKTIIPLQSESLPSSLYNILRFVYRQNNIGLKPSYGSISKELNISQPTTRKRINILVTNGYVREMVRGRIKSVELAERGKQYFWK